jgi:hypothetical protein
MKHAVYLFLLILFACTPTSVSPGMTFLQGLNQYRQGMAQLESRPERWPDRQAMGESLKTQYAYTMGPSAEFAQLVDLDVKRRELAIALSERSVKPDRAAEIKEELAKIAKTAAGLLEPLKAQIVNAEVRAQQAPQRVEAIAAIGLLTLGIEAFSLNRSPNLSITVSDRYRVTDNGPFSTVETPEGRIYRCSTLLSGDGAASIKCE